MAKSRFSLNFSLFLSICLRCQSLSSIDSIHTNVPILYIVRIETLFSSLANVGDAVRSTSLYRDKFTDKNEHTHKWNWWSIIFIVNSACTFFSSFLVPHLPLSLSLPRVSFLFVSFIGFSSWISCAICALPNKHESGIWRACSQRFTILCYRRRQSPSLALYPTYTEYVVVENAFHVIKMDEIDTRNADGSFLVHLDKQYDVNRCIPNEVECMFRSSEIRRLCPVC